MRAPIKNRIALTAVAFALYANTANATTVNVTIRNLSTEIISPSSTDFSPIPPMGTADRSFSFPDTTSIFDVTFRTPSGKACRFKGSHRSSGNMIANFTKEANSVGTGNPYCHANQTVQKHTAPFAYTLLFNITD